MALHYDKVTYSQATTAFTASVENGISGLYASTATTITDWGTTFQQSTDDIVIPAGTTLEMPFKQFKTSAGHYIIYHNGFLT